MPKTPFSGEKFFLGFMYAVSSIPSLATSCYSPLPPIHAKINLHPLLLCSMAQETDLYIVRAPDPVASCGSTGGSPITLFLTEAHLLVFPLTDPFSRPPIFLQASESQFCTLHLQAQGGNSFPR